ncbi:hypothetical protein FJTKL_11548 [Diaporthe vaccinii]|uniref:Uncharacterized protein n=1 Tax=Diaporthe vaccinii TaxID=105482 RepID=A0ABR4EG25_9PEZI
MASSAVGTSLGVKYTRVERHRHHHWMSLLPSWPLFRLRVDFLFSVMAHIQIRPCLVLPRNLDSRLNCLLPREAGRICSAVSSGYRSSLSRTPSSLRRGSSSVRYCWYCSLFSTLDLMPVVITWGQPIGIFVTKASLWLFAIPSKMRTAVGKSFTLRAALSAAVQTEGEGTRS